jgi:hypothetical protein
MIRKLNSPSLDQSGDLEKARTRQRAATFKEARAGIEIEPSITFVIIVTNRVPIQTDSYQQVQAGSKRPSFPMNGPIDGTQDALTTFLTTEALCSNCSEYKICLRQR